MSEERTEQKTEKVGVGTVIQFFDVPSESTKARKKWLRGRILSKTTIEELPIFLVVRENSNTYLVYPQDVRKDTIAAPFKTPKKFKHYFMDNAQALLDDIKALNSTGL